MTDLTDLYGAIKNYNVVLIPNSIFQIYSNLIDPIDHNSHLLCVKIGLLVIRAVLLKGAGYSDESRQTKKKLSANDAS